MINEQKIRKQVKQPKQVIIRKIRKTRIIILIMLPILATLFAFTFIISNVNAINADNQSFNTNNSNNTNNSINVSINNSVSILINNSINTTNTTEIAGNLNNTNATNKEQLIIESLQKDAGEIKIYFCKYNDCLNSLLGIINSSHSLKCAFYDLDITPLIEIIEEKDSFLVLEDKLQEDELIIGMNAEKYFVEKSSYMHHKFCVLDDKYLLTGSMNPTYNGVNKNNNNFFYIESKILAKNYINEIEHLAKGVEYNQTNIFALNDFVIENYFLPEHSKIVVERIISLINISNSTIDIAAFSFTSEEIFNAILETHLRGVKVRVLLEKRYMNAESSKYKILNELGIEVRFDNNPYSMHHKFIIIDSNVLETGSMNYSENAKTNNENIFIIYNNKIATAFLQEFDRLWSISG